MYDTRDRECTQLEGLTFLPAFTANAIDACPYRARGSRAVHRL